MAYLMAQQSGEWIDGDYFGTNDPVLGVILGTFGFRMRSKQPFSLVYDGSRIIQMIDKGTGDIGKLAHLQMVFEANATHKRYGRISCPQIARALDFCRLNQKLERGDLSFNMRAALENAQNACHRAKCTELMVEQVQLFLDFQTNWNVTCATIEELEKDPFIRFSRDLSRGITFMVNPLNTERATQNRSERIFKSTT